MIRAVEPYDEYQAPSPRAAGLTPRLIEILAQMAEAVLDEEDATRTTRGKIPSQPRTPRECRPAARRRAKEVQP